MSLTKKQIDIIRKNTPEKLKGKQMSLEQTLGYYRPYSANWSYCAGYVEYKGVMILIVTVFGKVM